MLLEGPIADIGAFIITIILVSIESEKIKKLIKLESDTQDNEVVNDKRFVICIGREFGSGGKYIGEELAKRLNIKCYDNELLKNISKNYNIDMNF